MLDRLDKVNERVGYITSFLILAIMFIISFEVVSRYALNAPTLWANDMCSYLQFVYYILGGGYALLHGLHVRVDLLYDRLSPKGQLLMNLTIGSILFFSYTGVMFWKSIEFAATSVVIRETARSGLWGGPVYPFKIMMPIGAFLIMFQWVLLIIRDIRNLKKYHVSEVEQIG